MVLYNNINVNQRVQVSYNGRIHHGTVKFKGCINGYEGEWVGVELNHPDGEHDGMVRGRRYFQCRDKHGIFCDARDIRFIPMSRKLFTSYRVVEPDFDDMDDELFSTSISRAFDEYTPTVSQRFSRRALAAFDNAEDDYSPYYGRRGHHLRHSVSNHIPAVTMLRPQTSRMRISPTPLAYRMEQDIGYDMPWISSPSIPKTHMPHSALQRQVELGWDRSTYAREMSVPYGRDAMKLSQWNDISE